MFGKGGSASASGVVQGKVGYDWELTFPAALLKNLLSPFYSFQVLLTPFWNNPRDHLLILVNSFGSPVRPPCIKAYYGAVHLSTATFVQPPIWRKNKFKAKKNIATRNFRHNPSDDNPSPPSDRETDSELDCGYEGQLRIFFSLLSKIPRLPITVMSVFTVGIRNRHNIVYGQ